MEASLSRLHPKPLYRVNELIPMIAVYVRISSHTQKTDSQKAELTQWMKCQKLPAKPITWFEDKESGRSFKRPAFQKLQEAIFDGRIKTVIVWKLDRLARNHREGINVFADWCRKDVRVVWVTQQSTSKAPWAMSWSGCCLV